MPLQLRLAHLLRRRCSATAGKSTLIEYLGLAALADGFSVAVIAIDPSSSRTGGSILGDKTRMPELSRSPRAFVRASPTRGALGGLAAHTNDVILLCEGAGFDVVFVETVGLGQSEVMVDACVDIVLLVLPPAGGDELQGSKKGIMEIADIIVVSARQYTSISLLLVNASYLTRLASHTLGRTCSCAKSIPFCALEVVLDSHNLSIGAREYMRGCYRVCLCVLFMSAGEQGRRVVRSVGAHSR